MLKYEILTLKDVWHNCLYLGPIWQREGQFSWVVSIKRPGCLLLVYHNGLKLFWKEYYFHAHAFSQNTYLLTYSLSKWSNYPFFIFLCSKLEFIYIASMKKIESQNYPNSIREILSRVFWRHGQIQKLVFTS